MATNLTGATSTNVANSVQTSSATDSAAKLAENFDTFLTLLTTQLRYQDPLDPMESNEFVSQLVNFTNVEQSIATNKNLEKMIEGQATNQMVGALGYIGKTVEAATDQVPFSGDDVDITYGLGETAATASLLISDASGKIVFSSPAETAAGKHKFTWDGTDLSGNTLPNAVYKVAVVAKNPDDGTITTATGVIGKVTGVDTTENGFLLAVGAAKFDPKNIISVIQPDS